MRYRQATIKIEPIPHSSQEALTDICYYIEAFYNRKRRHSTLGQGSRKPTERSNININITRLTCVSIATVES
jgi:hypothetical protein